MGRFIDLDKPLSVEDKAYLTRRSRSYLIAANERRFGVDGSREPEAHEQIGAPSQSVFYDTQERDRAVYDTGGAPLPGTTLDYNTGRAFDRENGVLVEPRPAGHTPGAYDSPFTERSDDDSDIDEDIAIEVTSLSIRDLESRLKEQELEVPDHKDISKLTKEQLAEELYNREVPSEKTDTKEDLQKKLKAKLSQERKEDMQNSLAIHLQDVRDGRI